MQQGCMASGKTVLEINNAAEDEFSQWLVEFAERYDLSLVEVSLIMSDAIGDLMEVMIEHQRGPSPSSGAGRAN